MAYMQQTEKKNRADLGQNKFMAIWMETSGHIKKLL